MAWEVKWEIENRVIYHRLYGDYTIEELEHVVNVLAEEYIEVGTPPVHLLIDASDLETYPSKISELRKFVHKLFDTKNTGWFVFYGIESTMARAAITAILYVFRVRFQHAASLEDGLAFLRRVDDSLPT